MLITFAPARAEDAEKIKNIMDKNGFEKTFINDKGDACGTTSDLDMANSVARKINSKFSLIMISSNPVND